jgi:hypothetical protein
MLLMKKKFKKKFTGKNHSFEEKRQFLIFSSVSDPDWIRIQSGQ